MLCTIRCKIFTLLISGLSLAIIGCVMYLALWKGIMNIAIKERLVLKEGSESYKFWKNVPVPIYIHFYLFNVTNPEEFYALEKPNLQELGPYTFREEREKVNITWNKNGTVSYRQIKRWYFQPDKTDGSLDDLVTTLNVPMIACASKAKQLDQGIIYLFMTTMFDDLESSWLVSKTVGEFLFKGYNDSILDTIKTLPVDAELPDKFGWFYKKNNTDDGEFIIHTGKNDIETVGEVTQWNGSETVTSYSPPCNKVAGSAGDIFSPWLSRKDKPTIFITDICRTLSFTYLEDIKINNIPTYRYWADDTQLDNGKYNPDHKCFCSEGDVCLPAGAVNVSTCKFDAPAVVSYPHFLFADPTYREGVNGMKPNPEEHRMYLDLIPEFGVPLGVAARMQINLVFDKIDKIDQFKNITRRTYFPMIWFSETAVAGTDVTDEMKLPLVTVPLIINIISFILVTIGSFLVLTAFVLSILYALGKKEPEYATVSSGNSKE